MLFSEPKIPQLRIGASYAPTRERFSALQRAENSSILPRLRLPQLRVRFSALQRAENSSMVLSAYRLRLYYTTFQCSSASRKFLNGRADQLRDVDAGVSVLFSEPKIPQLGQRAGVESLYDEVSVLFSEPKIPQFGSSPTNLNPVS